MRINPVKLYTKQDVKNEAKNAAISAGLSMGLTVAANKGRAPKEAAYVGFIAAGISLALGYLSRVLNSKNQPQKENLEPAQKSQALQTHQG